MSGDSRWPEDHWGASVQGRACSSWQRGCWHRKAAWPRSLGGPASRIAKGNHCPLGHGIQLLGGAVQTHSEKHNPLPAQDGLRPALRPLACGAVHCVQDQQGSRGSRPTAPSSAVLGLDSPKPCEGHCTLHNPKSRAACHRAQSPCAGPALPGDLRAPKDAGAEMAESQAGSHSKRPWSW